MERPFVKTTLVVHQSIGGREAAGQQEIAADDAALLIN
jgi:hypothetical protein